MRRWSSSSLTASLRLTLMRPLDLDLTNHRGKDDLAEERKGNGINPQYTMYFPEIFGDPENEKYAFRVLVPESFRDLVPEIFRNLVPENGKYPFGDLVPEIFGDLVPEIFRDLVPENGKYPFGDLVPENLQGPSP